MTYLQGFAHSSNVGMTLLQQKWGIPLGWITSVVSNLVFLLVLGMSDEYAGQLPHNVLLILP